MYLALVVLVPIVAAALSPTLARKMDGRSLGRLAALVPFALAAYFLTFLPEVAAGTVFSVELPWIPSLDILFSFYLDGYSLLFALIVTVVGALVFFYAGSYMSKDEDVGKFFLYMLVFLSAMLGVVLSDNLITLFLFWELTSYSSFLLIGFWYHRKESRYGALKALLVTVVGGLAMLAGFILLYIGFGTFSLRELTAMADAIQASPLYLPILVLLLLGAFSKSAQVPFHLWLPDAMEAPTPVSAYLHSATMVKAGIYLLGRMVPIFGGTVTWLGLVTGVGLVSLFVGAYLALKQTDLKAILAYSTISQLGLITSLFGFATPFAMAAAVFHILNHASFKGLLFLIVGIVDHETGSRDIRRLRGLAGAMPFTAAATGIGALAMAGVPPLNGFISKEMFFEAAVAWSGQAFPFWLIPVLAVAGSIFTFVYCMLVFHGVFLAGADGADWEGPPHPPHEAPWGLLLSPVLMAGWVVVTGLYPRLVEQSVVVPAAQSISTLPVEVNLYLWHGINVPLLLSLMVLGVGLALYVRFNTLAAVLARGPDHLNVNRLYDMSLDLLHDGAGWLTASHMTGYLRHYVAYITAFILLTVGTAAAVLWGFELGPLDLAPVTALDLLLGLLLVMGVAGTLFFTSRVALALSLATAGFAIVALFVIMRAPDLALTQFLVETVSIVLFLLVFMFLPRLSKKPAARSGGARSGEPAKIVPAQAGTGEMPGQRLPYPPPSDAPPMKLEVLPALLAGATGLLITLLMLGVNGLRDDAPLSTYFAANASELGGGNNIVNIILVDFRALDTLGEIGVLALAALGVAVLVRLRPNEADET